MVKQTEKISEAMISVKTKTDYPGDKLVLGKDLQHIKGSSQGRSFLFSEFRTVLPLARRHLVNYIAGMVFLLLTNAGQLMVPQIIGRVISTFTKTGFDPGLITELILLLLGLGLLISLGRWGWRIMIIGASRRIEASLREKMFQRWLLLGQDYFSNNKTGDLMALSTNDLRAVRMASGFSLIAFFDGSFLAISILIIVFTQYTSVAIWTIIPLPIITTLVLFMGRLVGVRFKAVQEAFSRLSAHVQEAFSGIKILQSFVQERSSEEKFSELNDEYKEANMSLVKLWGLFFPVVGLLSGVTTVILLAVGGPMVIRGEIDAGDFSALIMYLGMLVWPMISAGFTVNMIQRGAASMSRINKVLEAPIAIENLPNATKKIPGNELKVRNLSFRYSEDTPMVLKNISFTLPRGQMLGILGTTGSGKSTIAEILPRFLDPAPGTVFLGGEDIRGIDLSTLRQQYSLVPQNPFLFSMSIKENIAFGAPEASDEEIMAMADLSTITRDLTSFPKGMDTLVGEKGVTLSGGQKQRLTLARAMLVDSPLLILDDSLSAVDLETEENIMTHLRETRRQGSILLISHRVATLSKCDRILVLEDGEIRDQGTHQELLSREGLYRDIKILQDLSAGGEND